MSTYTTENKQLIQIFADEVINKRNLLALRDFLDPSIEGIVENIVTFHGINHVHMLLQMLFEKLPDFKIRIENFTAESDMVTIKIDVINNLLFEQNTSGNSNLHTFRIEWGKIAQYWGTLPIKIPHKALRILGNTEDFERLDQTYGYPTIPLE